MQNIKLIKSGGEKNGLCHEDSLLKSGCDEMKSRVYKMHKINIMTHSDSGYVG